MGPGGTPALGETSLSSSIWHTIPDPLHRDKSTFTNHKTLVIGSGHSAITTVSMLMKLKEENPSTSIIWMTRKGVGPYPIIPNDPLPERDRLNSLGNELSKGK